MLNRYPACLLIVVAGASVLLASSCTKKNETHRAELPVKIQQYYVRGEQLYAQHCSNCHQKNGAGLGLLYPPLDKSDYIDNNFDRVICLMKFGIEGELTVNGKKFNKAMPGVSSLADIEVTEIATYLYNSWGHRRDSITIMEVSRILNACERD